MNFATLKIFRDLIETKSFSKAASLNSITQSAVSQQVANLEKQFKCVLLDRTRKGFTVTGQGQCFYKASCHLIEVYSQLTVDLQEFDQRISGAVRVSTIYSIGLHELPPYIRQFLKQWPTINVHVEYRRSNSVYEDVLENNADIGLVAFPEKRAHLEIKPFRRDRLVLICSSGHRLASFRVMPIRQIMGHKFVGFDPDIPTRKALDQAFKKHRITVEQVMDFDNIETLKRAVEIDMGISIVPLSTVTQEIQNKTLKAVEFTDEEIFRPLGIVLRRDRTASFALKAFINLLESEPMSMRKELSM